VSASHSETQHAPLSVLVVDDIQDFREMYASYFSFAGVGVSTAIDGEEALQLSRAYPPDVIVLDLCMPGMSGWQFLEHARTDPRLCRIPVVAITAYGDEESEQTARDAGAAAYIPKPCLPQFLLSVVRRAARHAEGKGV
jgi:CheY-like chemotaxis protein